MISKLTLASVVISVTHIKWHLSKQVFPLFPFLMTWVIFLIALIPLMESLTANQMMDIYRARQKMIEMRNPETQWRKSIIDNSPPIGFVAGE